MAIRYKCFIYIYLLLCSVCSLQAELAYHYHQPKQKRTEDAVAEALNYIVENPYSAPEHLFQQLYVVKNYAERYSGRKFDLSQILLSANDSFQGWKIPEKQLNSLINFIERNKIYFEFNMMCTDFEEDDEIHVENIGYMDY